MYESRETEIVREVLLGDAQAFEALVRNYQGPVFNLMLRNVSDVDVAADLTQEAFTKAYARLETFKIGKRFFPWLYSVALNVVRDWMRSKGRDLHVYMENASDMLRDEDRGDTQQALEDRLDGEKAFELILQLAPKYRETLILRFKHDFTMQEIAIALGITVSGAKMRLSRGMDVVRQQFKEMTNDC